MRLTGMDIRDTPPFTDLVKLDFNAQVNVFIGPNASGKSTILREIDAALGSEDKRPDSQYPRQWRDKHSLGLFFLGGTSRQEYFEDDWRADANGLLFGSKDWKTPDPPVVYIEPVRPGLRTLHDEDDTSQDDADVGEVFSGPFSGANFKAFYEKMLQKAGEMYDREENEDTPPYKRQAYRIHEVNKIAYPCVTAICSEVITGRDTSDYIQGIVPEELYYQAYANFDVVKIHSSLGINTIDKPNFSNIRPEDRPTYPGERGQAPLYAGFLSSGTQTTFLWIYWLALKMLHHYDFAEGWMKQPAILLIDEIENHLHPTWQRRVIPELRKCFPNLQIFATTHSPFVVAGLRSGQVHLLDRNSDGVVESSTNDHDIIGWTTDEILRTFMGVAEPTDEKTIERSKRLRELRRKESLSDEEREELETLRRQVNADFLSSRSPLALKRERYGEMMQRFIESRQNELSQDG